MAKAARTAKKAKAGEAVAEGFWHKPVLMNMVSDLLIVLGCAGLAWAAVTLVQRLPVFPLRELVVANAIEHVGRGQVEHAARTALHGNFFTVDLDAARAAFEKLPWVRRAEVRRRWPDGIELSVEEHVAVALWQRAEGEGRLVNSHGELFAATMPAGVSLPAFSGPEGSAPNMLARYREFEQALAPLGRRATTVVLTPREAWELRLDDGLLVELGRDQAKAPLAERLARLTEHHAVARSRLRAGGVVDMRYPNGFALRQGRGERNG